MKKYKIHRNYDVAVDPESPELIGLAITYDTPSHDLGGYREQIASGAFEKCLAGDHDVRLLHEHEEANILARESNETVELIPGERDLRVKFRLDQTSLGKDTFIRVRDRLLTKMSVGIDVIEEVWHDLETDSPIGIIQEAILSEISIVSQPAFEETDVRLMSLAEAKKKVDTKKLRSELRKMQFAVWKMKNRV